MLMMSDEAMAQFFAVALVVVAGLVWHYGLKYQEEEANRFARHLRAARAGEIMKGRADVTDNLSDPTLSDKEIDDFLLMLAALRDLISVPRPRLEALEMVAQAAQRYRSAKTSVQRFDARVDLDAALAELEAAG